MRAAPRPSAIAGLAVLPLLLAVAGGRGQPARDPRPPAVRAAGTAPDTLRRSSVPRPRAPYVLRDLCPGECCHLGDWTANTRLRIRARPSDSAAVAFYIAPGSAFTAAASEVHVEQLGVVVVRRRQPMTDESGVKRVFLPGDTLLVESDLGEGLVQVWYRGEEMILDRLWWPLDPEEPAPAASAVAELRQPFIARWWVRVSQDGRDGWLEMSESVDVSGNFDCS